MNFTFELYRNEDGEKMVYVCANSGASGAKYRYETIEDIGKAVARYMVYYQDEAESLDIPY